MQKWFWERVYESFMCVEIGKVITNCKNDKTLSKKINPGLFINLLENKYKL